MGELFNRDLVYRIGQSKVPMQLSDIADTDKPATVLKTSFTVERTSGKEPNIAKVQIWNLNESNRKLLQTAAEMIAEDRTAWNWPLAIEAGYVGSIEQIFSGDIVFVDTFKESVNWVTTIEAEDGGKKYRSKRINKSLGPGTTVQAVLQVAANALGVGLGNSAIQFASGSFRKGFVNFKKGVTLTGRAQKLLDRYVTSAGYSWSIQNGQLQVLAPNDTLLDFAVVLTPTTGLVGSPEKGEKGIVKAVSKLQGSITPGRRVKIESSAIKGEYKVETVTHSGDTWGTDWDTTFEGKPIT